MREERLCRRGLCSLMGAGRVMVLVLRRYKRERSRIGPIVLDIYVLEEEENIEGDIVDILADLSERYGNTPELLFEIVDITSRGEERSVAAYTSAKGGKILFQRPARLRRVILIDENVVRSQAPTPIEKLPSYAPPREVYVFAGEIASERSGVAGVLLETDMGSRLIWLSSRGVKRDSNSSKAG